MSGQIHAHMKPSRGKWTLRGTGTCTKNKVICVCEDVDHGLFLPSLQQPPSIFITSHSDSRGKKGEEERTRRNEYLSNNKLKGKEHSMCVCALIFH